MAMTPRAPITEVRDHDLMINLVDGMLRSLNKSADTLRGKATKLDGEIRSLARTKSTEPEEGLSETAKVDFANQEALTKKSLAEVEIGRATQQEAKEKEFKHINDQLAQIEKRRQTLLRWRRYMRTLDEEATRQRENEANYNQQLQDQQAREAAFFEKEIAPDLTKEDLTQIATECQKIIIFLETERKSCVEMLNSIEEIKEAFDNIHQVEQEQLETINEWDNEIDKEIAETEEELRDAPPGSPMARLLHETLESLKHEREDNKILRDETMRVAETTSPDSQERRDLERQYQQQRMDLNEIDRKIALAKEIKEKALQTAEMAPTSPDAEAVVSSPETQAMMERFHSTTAELQRSHGMLAASAGITAADQTQIGAADQTTGRAAKASQYKLAAHNVGEENRAAIFIKQRTKEILEQQRTLPLRIKQLDRSAPDYYEKRLQIEAERDSLIAEHRYLLDCQQRMNVDLNQLSKPRGNSLVSFEQWREEQRREGNLHIRNPVEAAAQKAPHPSDKPSQPKPLSPSG